MWTRRPHCIKELVTHMTVNLSRQLTYCMSSMAFRLGRTEPHPWPQDNLSHAIVTLEPVGSSHSVPAITPPAQPCLYLKVQEEVPR